MPSSIEMSILEATKAFQSSDNNGNLKSAHIMVAVRSSRVTERSWL